MKRAPAWVFIATLGGFLAGLSAQASPPPLDRYETAQWELSLAALHALLHGPFPDDYEGFRPLRETRLADWKVEVSSERLALPVLDLQKKVLKVSSAIGTFEDPRYSLLSAVLMDFPTFTHREALTLDDRIRFTAAAFLLQRGTSEHVAFAHANRITMKRMLFASAAWRPTTGDSLSAQGYSALSVGFEFLTLVTPQGERKQLPSPRTVLAQQSGIQETKLPQIIRITDDELVLLVWQNTPLSEQAAALHYSLKKDQVEVVAQPAETVAGMIALRVAQQMLPSYLRYCIQLTTANPGADPCGILTVATVNWAEALLRLVGTPVKRLGANSASVFLVPTPTANPDFFWLDGQQRIAVTGDRPGAEIYVNVETLRDREKLAFTVVDAMAVLIHEHGHHLGERDHAKLDRIAARLVQPLRSQSETITIARPGIAEESWFNLELATFGEGARWSFPEWSNLNWLWREPLIASATLFTSRGWKREWIPTLTHLQPGYTHADLNGSDWQAPAGLWLSGAYQINESQITFRDGSPRPGLLRRFEWGQHWDHTHPLTVEWSDQ